MSRLTVQVVLRMRTSTSPVWSAGPRWSAVEGAELDRLGVAEDGGRDSAAEVGVEAGVLAALVEEAEAGKLAVHAADQVAAALHGGEAAGPGGGRLGLLGGLALLRSLALQRNPGWWRARWRPAEGPVSPHAASTRASTTRATKETR